MADARRMMRLSAYRAMWLLVLFDLPVKSKPQRKLATSSREYLLKDGFSRIQYSVYTRPCPSEENAQVHRRRVQQAVPPEGLVRILVFTDKQFSRMDCYQGAIPVAPESQPRQLDLF